MAYIGVANIGQQRYFQRTSLPTGNSKNLERVVRRKSVSGEVSRPLAMRNIAVSYTHLDVYKRQVIRQHRLGQ